jgi:hypothetical protein
LTTFGTPVDDGHRVTLGAMDVAYDPAAWQSLYLMVGGAAAVLTGLIFVAMSPHLHTILSDRWLRGRAESSLLALAAVMLISGAVLVPEQPLPALGVEITVFALATHAHSMRGLMHLPAGPRLRPGLELGAGLAGALLALLGGLSLVVHWGGGLWLLLPGGAIAIVSSVWNAWRLMVDIAAETGT